ncbi:MAG: efflux RND transporter periplasmic adaptor subunit [Patescibacteria group bacterium]
MQVPKFFKSKIVWTIAIIIVGGSVYAALKPAPQPEYTTAKAEKQQLIQTVSVTGTVRGAEERELNFETTGEIQDLFVQKGDSVLAGQVLAQLSTKQIMDSVEESQAAVVAAQAELQKLLAGASAVEIAVTQQRLNAAEVALSLRQQELADLQVQLIVDEKTKEDAVSDAERDAVTSRDNVLRIMETELFDAETAVDHVQDIVDDTDKDDTLGIQNLVLTQATIAALPGVNTKVADARTGVAQASASLSEVDLEVALMQTYSALLAATDLMDDMNTILEATPASSSYTQSEVDADQATIQSDHATLSTSISSLQTSEVTWEGKKTAVTTAENALATFLASRTTQLNQAQGAVNSAVAEVSLVQAELTQLTSPARSEDIALQRARVSQAQAGLERARADLDKATLAAPIDGTVTDIFYEPGENTSLSDPVMNMIGQSGLEIEVDIPESDIAKIRVGEKADITLDAFGDEVVFPGHVIFVDPAETVIQDVVYYKVTVAFDNTEVIGVKPGMTANIDIVTAELSDVIAVPSRAVKGRNGSKYVEVLQGEQVIQKEVTTGLRGDGGLIEVVSGLSGGEDVITFVELPQ